MGGKGSGGHNRLPTEKHIARGSYRKDRHGELPANLRVVRPPPYPKAPAGLDDYERACYAALREVLERRPRQRPRQRPRVEHLVVFAVLLPRADLCSANDHGALREHIHALIDRTLTHDCGLTEQEWNDLDRLVCERWPAPDA
jgi:hypothetical protein